MEWAQIFTLVAANATFFLGMIGFTLKLQVESREDWVRSQNTLDGFRDTINAIREEMSDFHRRLLEIEIKKRRE